MTLFFQNHPVLLFVVLTGCFLLMPNATFAQVVDNNLFEKAVNWVLYGVFMFFSLFVSLAATLFLWVIDVNVFSGLMNQGAIYTVWLTVRDFCNIFFILVLLFSAFATIFQLDKYEWKKTIPLLIIMALLVNFSFPISRFIVDLANVPMYFFAQNAFGGISRDIVENILGASKIQEIILPKVTSASEAAEAPLPQMLAAVVCMFLFGVSFLILAVLMLIRMIALAILIMFSPIGFVGLITPALHKFAHDWWDKLFKWAFYGPIAVMLVLVAITVMRAAAVVQKENPMQNLVGADWLSAFISSVAFFTIPIILFWIAITSAEKYSNDMSGLGIKWASQLGRWGGRTLTGYNWGMRRYGAYSAERKRRSDAKFADSNWGTRFGRFINSGLDRTPIVRGNADAARNRIYQEDKRLVEETAKRLNVGVLGVDELERLRDHGTKAEKGAALKQLVENGNVTRADLVNVRKTFGDDSQITRDFEAKMRAFDPQAVFTKGFTTNANGDIIGGEFKEGRLKGFIESNQFDAKKLSARSLTPELMRYGIEARTISNKDIEELRSKGGAYVSQVRNALDGAISAITRDIQLGVVTGLDASGAVVNGTGLTDAQINGRLGDFEVLRNAQMAHLAQTGEFHSSVRSDNTAKATLLQRADADSMKRMSSATIGANLGLIGDNVGGKYVQIIEEMAKNNIANAQQIKNYINMSATTGMTGLPGVPVSANLRRLNSLNSDHRIMHI